jgi:hypothetical protein
VAVIANCVWIGVEHAMTHRLETQRTSPFVVCHGLISHLCLCVCFHTYVSSWIFLLSVKFSSNLVITLYILCPFKALCVISFYRLDVFVIVLFQAFSVLTQFHFYLLSPWLFLFFFNCRDFYCFMLLLLDSDEFSASAVFSELLHYLSELFPFFYLHFIIYPYSFILFVYFSFV